MNRLIRFFLNQSLLVNLITVGTIVAGVALALSMKREAFPNIDFDIVVVTTVYPGASPLDVENLVTNRIERELRAVEDMKRVQSYSIEGRSAVTIVIEPDAPDKDKVIDDIETALEKVDDLPDDAEEPELLEISSRNTPVIEISLSPIPDENLKDDKTWPEPDEWAIRHYAKLLKERLEDMDGVSSVSTNGYREKEIQVEVQPEKLSGFNLALNQFSAALRGKNVNIPGGTIKTSEEDKIIRVLGEFKTPQGIARVILRSNDIGNVVRVRDVAKVTETFEEEKIKERTLARQAINLVVLKKESADTIELVDEIYADLDRFKTDVLQQELGAVHGKQWKTMGTPYNSNIKITTLNDISFYIRRRLGVLQSNAIIGLTLVISSLFFFMGWRIALMTALGIPISFAGAFIFLEAFGISINLLSMFGLIVVLGMLVDDAIVVAENVYRYIEGGMSPLEACNVGTIEVIAPVSATIATTVSAFAPLMFMTGIMGKFIWVIPAVVIICLLMSLLESFFILPSHLHDFTRNAPEGSLTKKDDALESRIFYFLQDIYRPILLFFLKNRYTVAVSAIFALIVSGALGFSTGFKLFPPGGIEAFFIKAEAPTGVPLEKMSELVEKIEKKVLAYPPMKLPREEFNYPKEAPDFEQKYAEYINGREPKSGVLDTFVTRVGIIQENPNDPFSKRGSNFAQLAVFLSPEDYRPDIKAFEIMDQLRAELNYQNPVKKILPVEGKRFLYVMNKPGVDALGPGYKHFETAKQMPPGLKELVAAFAKGHSKNIVTAAAGPGGKAIVTYGEDAKLILWNAKDGSILAERLVEDRLKKKLNLIEFISFSPDGSHIYTGNLTGGLKVFNRQLEEVAQLIGHRGRISATAASPDGSKLYSADWSGTLIAWNRDGDDYSQDWMKFRDWQYLDGDPVPNIADYTQHKLSLHEVYARISRGFQNGGGDALEKLASDFANNEQLQRAHVRGQRIAKRLAALSKKNTDVAAADQGGFVGAQQKAAQKKEFATALKKKGAQGKGQGTEFEPKVHLQSPFAKISGLELIQGGRFLVTGHADRIVRIYDTQTGKLVTQTKFMAEPISVMASTPNYIYFGGEEGSITRLNIQKLQRIRSAPQPMPGAVRTLAYDADGNHLLAGGLYNNMRAYNANSFALRKVIVQNQPEFTKMEFKEVQGGPPQGANVNVVIRGDSLVTLKLLAEEVKQALKAETGVTDVKDNLEEGKTEVRIAIDDVEAAIVGVTDQVIGADIRTAFDGSVATVIKDLDEDIDVRVIFPEEYRKNLQSLNKVYVANSAGNLIPLTNLVQLKQDKGFSQINHYDFKRSIAVTANVDPDLNNSNAVNAKMKELFEKYIPKRYPGYSVNFAGENEDTEESMQALGKAQLVAMALILTILIVLFGNFRHPRVVFAAIPFSLIGVFISFFFHGMPLSFLAFFGIVGLSGVVVNDSIILVEFINKMRARGMSITDSVVVGGQVRLRAVLLTTITTVTGVLPTAYGLGGDDPFLRPMAMALGWGLFFGSALILLVVPAFYAIWEDRGFVFRHMYDKRFVDDTQTHTKLGEN